MTDSLAKFRELLGNERLEDKTKPSNDQSSDLTNSNDIYCPCKTLILRAEHAKLIMPSETMLEVERDLVYLKHSDKLIEKLVRGCYWLVDDMYKFEQIGYTKQVSPEIQRRLATSELAGEKTEDHANQSDQANDETCEKSTKESTRDEQTIPIALRYLVCAECNLCPLGWFDSRTKESYLYVW